MPDEYDDDVAAQLDAEDTLDDRGPADPLDEGWSPPERPWAVDGWGVTTREEAAGESLDGRLARELPDVPAFADADADADDADDDGLGDAADTDGELRDDEVGDRRSGRLVAADGGDPVDGDPVDEDEELFASDVGIDGAGASAEEAAVHVVGEWRGTAVT